MIRLLKTIAIAMVFLPFAAAAHAQADTAAFMGTWALTFDSPQGPLEQNVVLKEDGGKLVAEILTSPIVPEMQTVTDVTKDKESLVVKFPGNFQGNAFDAVITMTPDGTDKAKVSFDVNGGQFTMSGTGVKK